MKLPGLIRSKPLADTGAALDLQKAGSTVTQTGWRALVSGFVNLVADSGKRPSLDQVRKFPPVARATAIIVGDLAKLSIKVMREGPDGVPVEDRSRRNPYVQTLRYPNRYQNRKELIETVAGHLLNYGNAFLLKRRDNANVVRELYPVWPESMQIRLAEGGRLFYTLGNDDFLPAWAQNQTFAASDIIHIRIFTGNHPIIGTPPLLNACLSGQMGVQIMESAQAFFGNAAAPSGALVADGDVTPEDAKKHKETWDANFTGKGLGRVAVLGGGLKWVPFSVPSRDSQTAEQLKLSAQLVGVAYGVSEWKMGLTPPPSFPNAVQSLNLTYYSDTLQYYIETIELSLTHGLEMPDGMYAEFATDELLRMDHLTQMEVVTKGTGGAVLTTNEGRSRLGYRATPGGDSVLRQQQDHSTAAIDARDRLAPAGMAPSASGSDETKKALAAFKKGLSA